MCKGKAGQTERTVRKIAAAAEEGHGFVPVSVIRSLGATSQTLSRMLEAGSVTRLARGLYGVPGVELDHYALLSARFPAGAFSHESALFLHGLADEPETASMTFPLSRRSMASMAKEAGVAMHVYSDAVVSVGLGTALTPLGATVPAHGPERAICDLVYRESDPDLGTVARYVAAFLSGGGDRARLIETARSMGEARTVGDVVKIVEGGLR